MAAIAYFVIVSAGIKSTEAQNRSNLSSLRSAVGLYYSDKEGQYPECLEALVPGGRYLTEDPSLCQGSPFYSPHWRSRAAVSHPSRTAQDSGRWGYVDNPKDAEFGQVFIDCSHTDSRGARWDSY